MPARMTTVRPRLTSCERIRRRRRCTLNSIVCASYGTLSSEIGPTVMNSLSPTLGTIRGQERDEHVGLVALRKSMEHAWSVVLDLGLADDHIELPAVGQLQFDVGMFAPPRAALRGHQIRDRELPRWLVLTVTAKRQSSLGDGQDAVCGSRLGLGPDNPGVPEGAWRTHGTEGQQPTGGRRNQNGWLGTVLAAQNRQHDGEGQESRDGGDQPGHHSAERQFCRAPRGVTAMWMR